MRVKELAHAMRVPYIDIYDDAFKGGDFDFFSILQTVEFDGKLFDKHRCESWLKYKAWMVKYGIPPNPNIDGLC